MPKKIALIFTLSIKHDAIKKFMEVFRKYNNNLMLFSNYENSNKSEILKYTERCNVLIFLYSQEIMSNEDFLNSEIFPQIVKRKKTENISLIGVRFEDAEISLWDKSDWFNFFPARNGDFDIRREGRYRNKHNSDYVVFEKLDPSDFNSYHMKLSSFIESELLEMNSRNSDKLEFILRDRDKTKKILDKMKKGTLLYLIEERLSDENFKKQWKESFTIPEYHDRSYAWWFLLEQSKYFRRLCDELNLKNCIDTCIETDKRLELLIELCGGAKRNELFENLVESRNQINLCKEKFIFETNNKVSITSDIKKHLYKIYQSLNELALEALNISKN